MDIAFIHEELRLLKQLGFLNDIVTQYSGLKDGTWQQLGEIRASASAGAMCFRGTWNFSGATVKGLKITFG